MKLDWACYVSSLFMLEWNARRDENIVQLRGKKGLSARRLQISLLAWVIVQHMVQLKVLKEVLV